MSVKYFPFLISYCLYDSLLLSQTHACGNSANVAMFYVDANDKITILLALSSSTLHCFEQLEVKKKFEHLNSTLKENP